MYCSLKIISPLVLGFGLFLRTQYRNNHPIITMLYCCYKYHHEKRNPESTEWALKSQMCNGNFILKIEPKKTLSLKLFYLFLPPSSMDCLVDLSVSVVEAVNCLPCDRHQLSLADSIAGSTLFYLKEERRKVSGCYHQPLQRHRGIFKPAQINCLIKGGLYPTTTLLI